MKNFKLYKVGGCVRDKIMNIDCKDIDFTVVCSLPDMTVSTAFNLLLAELAEDGFTVFQKHEEYATIRAKFPKNHVFETLVADFVLARKEFYDGINRQPTHVTLGTIFDDLERRDFTVNAIAECIETGDLVDPFGGIVDIEKGVLKTTRDAEEVLAQDSLRALRALRFSITKGFSISRDLRRAISNIDATKLSMCSQERMREEMLKMFSFDTYESLKLLQDFQNIQYFVFADNKLWLKPTLESK